MYQKALTLDVSNERESLNLNFESCHVAPIEVNYYNTVSSSRNAAYKRSRKFYK